jgi:hypothetical protein
MQILSLLYRKKKICLKGVCTPNSLAPITDCPFGDDLYPWNTVGDVKLPFNNTPTACQAVIDYLITIGQSPSHHCKDTYLYSICCQTCKSNSIFLFFCFLSFYMTLLTFSFSFRIFITYMRRRAISV